MARARRSQVGGKSVLAAATAGVIGSRYTLLDSGSLPVTLTVNGAAVAVPNVTLQAGADYTLLVWSNAQGRRPASWSTTTVCRPAAAVAKLRLLNGMSTLAAPLTLSIDFSPVIEGTLIGQVSDEVEVTVAPTGSSTSRTRRPRPQVLTRTGAHAAAELGLHVLHDGQRRDGDRRPAPRPVRRAG